MPGVRGPQGFRRPPVSPLLASVGEKLNLSDKKREAICLPFFIAACESLMHGYFDLSRLGLFGLGHAYLEQTVFVSGFDALVLHGLGQ